MEPFATLELQSWEHEQQYDYRRQQDKSYG